MNEREDSLRQLAGWISSWDWPVTRARMLEMGEEHGWVLALDQPKSIEWDTDLPPGVSAVVLDDAVVDVTITTSEDLDDDPAGRPALGDHFAGQVDVVSQVLGAPDRRRPGRIPSATWDLPNGSALEVGAAAGGCFWTVTSPKFVEIERDLGPDA